MKRVFLFRHAKSEWGGPSLGDRDRPLQERGRRDALRMGQYIRDSGWHIDHCSCSSARRAMETLEGLRAYAPMASYELHDTLYLASEEALLTHIASTPESIDHLAVIAHDPGISILAHRWSSSIDHMPTCALALFCSDARCWLDFADGIPMRLEVYRTPKMFRVEGWGEALQADDN